MAVFKCKMCGANLEISENQSVVMCEYCKTHQTLPKFDDDRKISLFTRANHLRFNCEFDKAAGIYESIVTEYPDEAEAYWGLVLCKYGIEYVDDMNDRKIPTCHRTVPLSVMDDEDFCLACDYADITSKNVYRNEAKVIDSIQKKILKIVATEKSYDIFICYKETDDVTGLRTEDSSIAQDIYTALTEKGYKVFYARNSLRRVAGTEYEPYIYAALSSAKIMLVIGTKYEYYDAVWVKNEWSRFISMMADNSSKRLIPCYKDMEAYDMPKEFRNMQGLDMGEITFFDSLMSNVESIATKKKEDSIIKKNPVKKTVLTVMKLKEEKEKLMAQANAIDLKRKRSLPIIFSGILTFFVLVIMLGVVAELLVRVICWGVSITILGFCISYKTPSKKVINERAKQKEVLLKQCDELQRKIDSYM